MKYGDLYVEVSSFVRIAFDEIFFNSFLRLPQIRAGEGIEVIEKRLRLRRTGLIALHHEIVIIGCTKREGKLN